MNNKQYKFWAAYLCLVVVISIVIFTFIHRDYIENNEITGYFGLFIACLASTSTILLPAPGIIVVMQYASILNPFWVIAIGALGTTLGELTGYFLGRCGVEVINLNTNKKLFKFIENRGYIAVLIASSIPFPVFDVVGILSGIMNLNIFKFICSCYVGKFIKLLVYVLFAENLIDIALKLLKV